MKIESLPPQTFKYSDLNDDVFFGQRQQLLYMYACMYVSIFIYKQSYVIWHMIQVCAYTGHGFYDRGHDPAVVSQ